MKGEAMKLSTKGKYGLIALADLALAYNADPRDSFLVLRTIAEKRNISEAYLERIISRLKKAGIVITQRGSMGGYSLSSSPEEITVGRVLEVLEGPLDVCGCAADTEAAGNGCSRDDGKGCSRVESCVSKIVCEEINAKIAEAIGSMTIQDVLRRHHSIEEEM